MGEHHDIGSRVELVHEPIAYIDNEPEMARAPLHDLGKQKRAALVIGECQKLPAQFGLHTVRGTEHSFLRRPDLHVAYGRAFAARQSRRGRLNAIPRSMASHFTCRTSSASSNRSAKRPARAAASDASRRSTPR